MGRLYYDWLIDRTMLTSRSVSILLTLGFAASVAFNILLVFRLREAGASRPGKTAAGPALGATLPSFVVRGGSASVTIPPNGEPAILYWFSMKCPWSVRNQSNAETLARASAGKYRFVAVAPGGEGASRIAKANKWAFDVYEVDDKVRKAWNLKSTPVTIMVDKTGSVTKIWRGAYSPEFGKDLAETVGLRVAFTPLPRRVERP